MKSTKSLIVVTIVLVLSLGLAGIANAITFGQPDGSRHPNVGVMVVEWPDGSMGLMCSGSLIAQKVFLTAAHCTHYLATHGVPSDHVWVSFDPVVDRNATLHHGVYKINPNYGHDEANPNDVAVVILDEPITGVTLAQLPAAGLLDQMKDAGTLKRQTFTTVGYGMVRDDKTGGWHSMADTNERRYVVQSFLALKPAWIQLSMNPSTGNGGTCYGDSGGPHFIGDSNVVAAITVTGDRYCRATDVDYRMDTESARSYLSQFVKVP